MYLKTTGEIKERRAVKERTDFFWWVLRPMGLMLVFFSVPSQMCHHWFAFPLPLISQWVVPEIERLWSRDEASPTCLQAGCVHVTLTDTLNLFWNVVSFLCRCLYSQASALLHTADVCWAVRTYDSLGKLLLIWLEELRTEKTKPNSEIQQSNV